MFIDRAKIYVKAGAGGNGCISFQREKYMPKGGPNGGDGGRGGSVILRATKERDSLSDLKYNQHVTARSGGNGLGSDKHGPTAEDLVVSVPLGTVIMDIENGNYVVADLDTEGQEVLVAQGGQGGRGNKSFATSTNRAPRQATPGVVGEERTLMLELKTIADAGLVGYPNAGKSTFLNSVSDARPKTAPYPFTTLHPMVGVLEFEDYSRMTIADIPGLIEGASENVGLGHHFLRHIERTKVLVYVLDMAATDNREPLDDYNSLKNELELYQEGITERPTIVIANKMDGELALENLEKLKAEVDLPIYTTMAEIGEGTAEVVAALRAIVIELRQTEAPRVALKDVHSSKEFIFVDLDADGDDFGGGDFFE